MKNYLNYEVEDFVQDHYFRKWTLGELPSEDQFWETWQKSHPDQYEKLERAKSLVIALRINTIDATPDEIKQAIDRILLDTEDKPTIPIYRRSWAYVAASVILVLGFGYWTVRWNGKPVQEKSLVSSSESISSEEKLLFSSEQKREITLRTEVGLR
jgi:transmembrane sensor